MTEETSSSWRDTLYVWDGILFPSTSDEGSSACRWEGFWVACEGCPDACKAEAPQRKGSAKDIESTNSFTVTGTAKPVEKEKDTQEEKDKNEKKDTSARTAKPHMASLTDGEGWSMDGEKYKDDVHDILLESIRWMGDGFDERGNLVFGRGSNKFGNFVSAGWMRPGNRITLARRYLPSDDSDDPRAKWTLDELKGAVLAEIFDADSGDVRIPPWQCAALHSEFQQGQPPSKKSKTE